MSNNDSNGVYNITGIIHTIGERTEIGTSGKEKQEVVLLVGDKWPQYVPFEAFGDRVDSLEGRKEGEEVTIRFALKGREWNGPKGVRYFGSNSVLEVETTIKQTTKPKQAAKAPARAAQADDGIDF